MTEEGADRPKPTAPGRSAPLGLKIGAVVLVVIAVALAVVAVFEGRRVMDGNATKDQRSKVLTAAKQETVNILNVDYQTAKQASARVLAGATGEFKDQWGSSYSPQFLDTIVANKAKQAVSSVQAGVVTMNDNRAEVILSVSSVVTSPQNTTGVQRLYRIDMQLQKQGGRWLVSTFGLVT